MTTFSVSASCHGDSHLGRLAVAAPIGPTVRKTSLRLLSRRFTPQPGDSGSHAGPQTPIIVFPPPVTEIHTSASSSPIYQLISHVPVSASCHGDSHLSQTPFTVVASQAARFPPPVTEIHTSASPTSVRVACCSRSVSASCHGDSHLSLGRQWQRCLWGVNSFRLLSRRFTPQPDGRRPQSRIQKYRFPPPVTEIHTSAHHRKCCCLGTNRVSASCHGDSHLSRSNWDNATGASRGFRLLSRRFTPQPYQLVVMTIGL